ncbi:MAG: alcohol dehydrogenase catalytic domain-containing protein [Deltaproteobacteria bacterium]|nr:alcohol dehydrogenase catalytic domain-containing protein [Deltaproteobacteria bacterium]
MKALVVDAEWSPRQGYILGKAEENTKRALMGSRAWRNPTFAIKDVPKPAPKDDELLIKVKVCGICGSDTHLYETDKDGYIIFSGLTKLPCVIGHEFSGVVEKVGDRVTEFKVGDFVAVESVMWCGMCTSCRSGALNQCSNVELMGLSSDGAFAQYAAVNARYCWKIDDLKDVYDDDKMFEVGALIEPIGCAYNGIFIAGGGFRPGAIVVVYGAGPIGLGAIALSRACGASLVIAFDVTEGRVEIATRLGADYAFNVNDMDGRTASDIVMELTKGWGADIQVEAAGAALYTVPQMEKAMSVNGKIIYLGRAATSTSMHLDNLVTGANKIIGARGHSGYGIFPSIIKMIANNRLRPEGIITSVFPFEKIMDAMKLSTTRQDGKILIKMPD